MTNTRDTSRSQRGLWMAVLLTATGCGQSSGSEPGLLRRLRNALGDGTPDLRVTQVRAPSSAAPGMPLTVTVTVCNAGSGPASTHADVYLSDDSLLQPTDLMLTSFPVSLQPGQCATHDASLGMGVDQPGSYHLGALADPTNSVAESDEGNNALANPLAVDMKPDLVVTSVVGPVRVYTYDHSPTVFATVCNQGVTSPSTYVDLFLSTDTAITPEDLFLGNLWLESLASGACTTLSVPTSQSYVTGLYYLGARVDGANELPEILEDNNTLASHRMALGSGPDLVITSVQAPASWRPGELLNVSATVCNRGFEYSAHSELTVHLSSDATVTPEDPLLGSVSVGFLERDECTTASVMTDTAPATAGGYTLGAFADAHGAIPELYEDNNASAPRALTLGHDADLIVSLEAPAVASPGTSFRYTATVCNQGTLPSEPASLELFLSTDTTFTSEDMPLDSASVPQLAAGACTTLTREAPANAPPASPTFLGAIVDRTHEAPELLEDNNTSAPSLLAIGQGPDLVVASVSAPTSAESGSFQATLRVCNQGTDPSPSSLVELTMSPLHMGGPLELRSGHASVYPLDPGACAEVPVDVAVGYPLHSGTWQLAASVDPTRDIPELVESNNSATSHRIGLGAAPDFVVSTVSGPTRMLPYSSPETSVLVTVCNQGTRGDSPSLELKLSQDRSITREDPLVGHQPVGYLEAGECRSLSVYFNSSLPEGIWHLGALVPHYGYELFGDNNAAAGNRVAIGHGPDLVVTSVQAPASLQPGATFTPTATVCNQGFGPSYDSQLEMRLVPDTGGSPQQDIHFGAMTVGYLEPSTCTTVSLTGSTSAPEGRYAFIATADVSQSIHELYEDNNESAPRSLVIGAGPDLTVSVSAPAVALPGSTFELSATVCNQGTLSSPPSHVQAFISPDATLSSEDMYLAGEPVDELQPGQCVTRNLPASAWQPAGTWFVGALVDDGHTVQELLEDNNTSAASPLVIGHGPDLIVTSVSTPPSALPDSSFEATVRVCNQGFDHSPSSELKLTLAPPDLGTPVGLPSDIAFVGPLDPGACADVTAPVSTYQRTPGIYTLTALADSQASVPELVESNNSSTSGRIGIAYAPDFFVSSVSGPTRLSPYGNPYAAFFVTVCNQGATGDSADVELRLSHDTTPSSDDLMLGSSPVGLVDPGQCGTVTLETSSWGSLPEGTFHVGATVRSSPQELIRDNNRAMGHRVAIGSRPDLVITSVQAPASLEPNASLSVTARVCNQGNAPSYGAESAVYLSADATVNPMEDFLLGHAPTGHLDPGQCTTATVAQPVFMPGGRYFLAASVDDAQSIAELYEDNNVSPASLLVIGSGMDLTVSLVAPALARPGEPVSVTATVCNPGTQPSAPANVDILVSPDATLSLEDMLLGGAPVEPLAPGACSTHALVVNPSAPEGTAFLGALVDGPNMLAELREDNNTSTASAFVTGHGPDLTVTSVSTPPSAMPGSTFEATATVCNQGFEHSPSSQVELRLAPLDVGSPVSFLAGSAFVGPLDPGACERFTTPIPANVPIHGAWSLLVLADASHSVPELIESNNSATSHHIGISHAADLAVTSVSGPTRMRPSGSPEASTFVTVCNQGQSSAPADVEVRLSQDATITRDDFIIGNASMGYLEPGQCNSVSVPHGSSWMPEGTFYLGASVWFSPDELFVDDNTATGNRVAVGDRPDLTVTSVQAPASLQPGAPLSVTATVCNEGFVYSPSTDLAVRLSQDTTFSPDDYVLGTTAVSDIERGTCTTATVTGPASLPEGTWFLLASADAYQSAQELYEDNNDSAPQALSIGTGPDLVVSVSAPASARPGDPLTVTATVCNQGNQPSGNSGVDVFLSADATFTHADPMLGGAPVDPLEPGACTTRTVQASVSQPEGPWFLGALADGFNGVPELREDNNVSELSAFVIGYGPDLVVTSVTGPASALPGSTFTATVQVCNQGNQSGAASTVELRLEAGGVDFPAGNAFVGQLVPGACESVTVNATADVSPRGYTLVALADVFQSVPELIESNNRASGSRMGIGSAPDFFVSALSGPTRISAYGNPMPSVLVTVCNQGTVSDYAHVELKLSPDAFIGRDEPMLGTAAMGSLEPGQCRTLGVPVSSSLPWGAFYLGAYLPDGFRELFEDNNTALGHRVVIGDESDLVVSSVQAPASVHSGAGLAVTATVCNHGFRPSYPSEVALLLSPEATVRREEALHLGLAQVGQLEPSQCTPVTVTSSASIPSGSWFLAALADASSFVPEMDEDNNLSTPSALVAGDGPDLTVSVSAPAPARPGESFTVTATVCNQGTLPGQPTSVDVVLSQDAVLSSKDPLLGGAPVGALEPGACEVLPVQASAWHPEGPWFLGAIVDGYNGVPELREDNNFSAASAFGLGEGPDLAVTSVQAPTASKPDSTFPATLEVCNRGNAPSPSALVELMLTAQGLATPVDLPAGHVPVGGLAPGACESLSASVSSAVPMGAWKLTARVDGNQAVPELVESNNSTSSARLGIGHDADYVITSIDAPAVLAPWGGATVHVTVCNQGASFDSYGPSLWVVLAPDASVTSDDPRVSSEVSVSGFPPGECQTVDVPVGSIPTGTFHVGALLPPVMPELFRDNNTAVGPRVAVGAEADFHVTSVQAPASIPEGGLFTSTVTVCNQGFGYAATSVEVRLTRTAPVPESHLAGGVSLPELTPGTCQTFDVASQATVPAGEYTLEAVVDPHLQVGELLEDNNRGVGHTVTVTN